MIRVALFISPLTLTLDKLLPWTYLHYDRSLLLLRNTTTITNRAFAGAEKCDRKCILTCEELKVKHQNPYITDNSL
jgi:hypothetical protein